MISGKVLKYRNGFLIHGRYGVRLISSSRFPLTLPNHLFGWIADSADLIAALANREPT